MNLHNFLYGVYPYIALTVFLVGSVMRFDREQYTWKSDSSQLLSKANMRLASNLFHIGIIAIFFGHAVGLLTPHSVVSGAGCVGHDAPDDRHLGRLHFWCHVPDRRCHALAAPHVQHARVGGQPRLG